MYRGSCIFRESRTTYSLIYEGLPNTLTLFESQVTLWSR